MAISFAVPTFAQQKDTTDPQIAARIQAVLMTVAAGIGVSLAPSSVRSLYQPGVTFIPIQPELPPLDLVAARPAGEPPLTVTAFLDVLRQQLPQIRSKYAHNHST